MFARRLRMKIKVNYDFLTQRLIYFSKPDNKYKCQNLSKYCSGFGRILFSGFFYLTAMQTRFFRCKVCNYWHYLNRVKVSETSLWRPCRYYKRALSRFLWHLHWRYERPFVIYYFFCCLTILTKKIKMMFCFFYDI